MVREVCQRSTATTASTYNSFCPVLESSSRPGESPSVPSQRPRGLRVEERRPWERLGRVGHSSWPGLRSGDFWPCQSYGNSPFQGLIVLQKKMCFMFSPHRLLLLFKSVAGHDELCYDKAYRTNPIGFVSMQGFQTILPKPLALPPEMLRHSGGNTHCHNVGIS